MLSQRCSKCDTEKPITEFYENRHVKSGYFSRCKACVKAHQLAWSKTDAGKSAAQKFLKENAEKMKAYHLAYDRSEKGKQIRRDYWSSEHGKKTKKAYLHRKYGSEEAFRKARRSKLDSYETPEKAAAWRETQKAIRSGKLTRQPCACGNLRSHAHHEDYSKPLEVTWLCASCHQKLHYEKRQLQNLDSY